MVKRSFGLRAAGHGSLACACLLAVLGVSPLDAATGLTIPGAGSGFLILTSATVGQSYSAQLPVSGGVAPYHWSTSGTPPPGGLVFNATGVLSGVPDVAVPQTTYFQVQVTDSSTEPQSATALIGLKINPPPLVIVTSSLPAAIAGLAFSQTLQATGGATPYTWSLLNTGCLTGTGLSFSAAGVLSGTPLAPGTVDCSMGVTDNNGTSAFQRLTLLVRPVVSILTLPALPAAPTGQPYAVTLLATGGTGGPYTWSIAQGSALPGGLALDPTGQVHGTPSATGSFSFVLLASDGISKAAQLTASLTLYAPLSITTGTLPAAIQAVPYSQTLSATGGLGTYLWSAVAGLSGTGLTLGSGGTLSGTPQAAGPIVFTARVKDDAGNQNDRTLTLPVNAALSVVSPPSLPAGVAGQDYLFIFSAKGGNGGPYTWTLASGSSLPGGLTLTSGGNLQGSPAAPGNSTFTVSVTDGVSPPASLAASLSIYAPVSLSSGPNPSHFGDSVTLTANIPNGATGSVSFKDGAALLGTGTIHAGSATLTTAALSVGSHSLTAAYAGDAVYPASNSVAVLQTVNPANTTTTLNSSPNPSTFRQAITLTASVSPATATGVVTFRDGTTTLGTASVSNGAATIVLSTLPAGSHSLTAAYGGDTNDGPGTSPSLTQTVNPAGTTTTLSFSANPATFGQSVILTGTVSPSTATGTVTFQEGGTSLGTATLNSGVATFAISTLAAGPHSLAAAYSGDANNASGTSAPVPLTVAQAAAKMLLTSTPNPSLAGQLVTMAATVSPSGATGSITFRDGASVLGTVPLNNGTATLAVSTLTAGTHSLNASYSGDSSYLAATVPLSAPVLTFLNAIPGTIADSNGLGTGFSARLPGTGASLPASDPNLTLDTVAGTLAWRTTPADLNGAVNLAAGDFLGVPVPGSDFSISATFRNVQFGQNSDQFGVFAGTSASSVFRGGVIFSGQASAFTAHTTGAADQNLQTSPSLAPHPGDDIVLTLSRTSGTWALTLRNLTNPANSGPLPLVQPAFLNDVSGLVAGIFAANTGNTTVRTETIGPFLLSGGVQTVNQVPTSTSMTSSPNPSLLGQPVTLTASVTPASATGTVTFKDGGSVLGTGTLSAGVATYGTAALTFGSHSLTAVYGGDAANAGSTSSVFVHAINQAPTTTSLTSSLNPSSFARNVTFTATVSRSSATGTVTFMDGSATLGSASLSGGTATFSTAGLTAGQHNVTAVYAGDGTNLASSSDPLAQTVNRAASETTLTSDRNPGLVAQALTLQASVTPLSATGTVNFQDGSTTLGSASLSGGTATLSVSLAFGPHSLTATYAGDSNHLASTSPVLSQNQMYPPLSITTPGLPAGQAGQPYGPATLMATGGSGLYSWSASGLPQGISLSSTGSLSGNSASGFSGSVTVTVTDGISHLTASASYTLSLAVPPLLLSGPANLGNVVAGAAVSGAFSASGGKPPYTWTVAGAAGLTVDAGGNVAGVAGIGTFTAVVTVTDSLNASASRNAAFSGFGITSGGLPPASTNSDYTASLSASGGTPPYSFTVSGLPPGMTFAGSSFGGRPLNPGSAAVAVQARDAAGLMVSASYTLTVTGPSALKIFTSALSDATAGQPYSEAISASGGVAPYTWSQSGGLLPAGLTLSSSGAVTGQTTMPGAYTLGAQVTDAAGNRAVGTVSLNVKPAPVTITNGAAFPSGIVGSEYPAQILTATGGVPPYTFSVRGSLPAGLSLANSQIGGTPTAAAVDGGFTLLATDSAQPPATGMLGVSLSIRPLSPDLVLAAGSASFEATAGTTSTPSPASIGVSSSISSVTIDFSTSASVPWLSVSGGSTAPGVVSIGLNAAALALTPDGSPYSGSVTVSCTSAVCAGKSQKIAVSYKVSAPPPQLMLGATLLSFAALASSPQASSASLTLINSGGGVLKINSVVSDSPWLTVGSFPGTVMPGPGGAVTLTVDPAGLAAGYYRGTVAVASSGGSGTVAVTLFISAAATMSLGPAGAQFTLPQGGLPGNAAGAFSVSASSGATVPFTAVALGGAPWLSVTSGSGTATAANSGAVGYAINPAAASALPAGAYYGTIRVSGSGVVNSPQDFQVVLNVTPATTPVLPDPQPAGLVFVSAGTAALASQTISVYASSRTALPFQASASTESGGNWLSISPTQGSASAAAAGAVVVSASAAGLKAGAYRGAVSFAFGTSVRAVNVTLIVQPPSTAPAGGSALPGSLSFKPAAAGPVCPNAQLVPTQTGLVSNFSAPTAWPTQLAVKLFDTCGSVVGTGQIVATFTNGDPPLPLTAVNSGSGLYSGTWTPRKSSAVVTITANVMASGYPGATIKIGGQVSPNSAPVLAPNATGDVFHPQVGAGLGPGNIVQIYGSGLASQTSSPVSLPLPTSMSGTSVLIGGVASPLFYVSPGQVNAQIPFELTAGNQYQLIVSANGALTTPQPIQLNGGTPSILNFSSGAVVAQHLDGTLILESSPAAPGEFVIIYSSGLGLTDIPVKSGAASPSDPPARVADPPVLTLNGNPITLQFAGLTPGLVGLYQVNFQVPANLTTGNYDLVLTQSGVPSNKSVLAIKQ